MADPPWFFVAMVPKPGGCASDRCVGACRRPKVTGSQGQLQEGMFASSLSLELVPALMGVTGVPAVILETELLIWLVVAFRASWTGLDGGMISVDAGVGVGV